MTGVLPPLDAESFPIRARRNSCMPLEERPEKCDILATDCVTDLLHRSMIAFQQALRGGDPQLLQICQWAVAGRLFETPDEVSQAHPGTPRRSFKRERPMKILMKPVLRRRDCLVVVLGFQRNHRKSGLPGPRCLNEQGL